jgi:hypothetical protein
LGVDPAIAKRCFNHSMGKVTATYDAGRYVAQRREAMDKLGKLVATGRAPSRRSPPRVQAAAPARAHALRGAQGRWRVWAVPEGE